MPKAAIPRPTDGELAILQVLWQRGPSTVREVYEALSPERKTGYTTTLKLMQIMAQKGLVRRDVSARQHVYEATCSEDQTQRQLIGDLLTQAFDGSARKLIMQALAAKKVSAGELAEIRKLLKESEEGG